MPTPTPPVAAASRQRVKTRPSLRHAASHSGRVRQAACGAAYVHEILRHKIKLTPTRARARDAAQALGHTAPATGGLRMSG